MYEMPMIYPLLFQPNLHALVWGGHKLKPYKGLPADEEPVGESWEVSAVEKSPSIVANGPLRGESLLDVVKSWGSNLLGTEICQKYDGQLPLLVKFIDAQRDLSIQVHPNDELARRRHGGFGKTEMWYIIHAEPGACLYSGMSQQITPEEYEARIADGTICDVLAKHEVKAGDVFYMPAGRVHAICSGIVLAEVQQTSDLTYRIFDYNRLGLDGKPRELHTAWAKDAIDYSVEQDYRTHYVAQPNSANLLIDSPFFTVSRLDVAAPFRRDLRPSDSFVIGMCMSGDCEIRLQSNLEQVAPELRTFQLREGDTCLIPAKLADYEIVPRNNQNETKILEAYIDTNKK